MNDARPSQEPTIFQEATGAASVAPTGAASVAPTGAASVAPAGTAAAPRTYPDDPEFDAYLSLVRLLLGGAIEGTAVLVRRLEQLEADLRAAEDGPPAPGDIHSTADLARYLLVGVSLSAADGLRRRAARWAEASDMFWRVTGSAVAPLAGNRLTGRVVGPFDRAFGRLVTRGQQRVNAWVELGRANEPTARLLARQTYLETLDDFIDLLSQNDELATLVQKKSLGLANEVVDEVRERTFSADTLAESVVRRILRRPPRQALPPPPDELLQAVAEMERAPSRDH